MATATTEAASAAGLEDILRSRKIRKVVVLGANGTMGYQSGALFTWAGIDTVFLARTAEKAASGLAAAQKAVRSTTVADHVRTDGYDALEAECADADLVFEAVAEDFNLKNEFLERIDKSRREDAIVATVSSGLSIAGLAAGRSASFQKHFCGLHFFNPPAVIVGTELIAGEHTDPEVIDFLDVFCTKQLGRVMIRTHDTPGFAGNRIGFKVLNEVAQLAEQHSPLLLDKLIGPYTGRAMSPLATIDLVGWDVHKAIVDNICEKTTDEAIGTQKLPDSMRHLIDQGFLGRKSGQGFFKKDTELLVLNPNDGSYTPASQIALPDMPFISEIAALHNVGAYREAMAKFVAAPGDEAQLAREVIFGYISYGFCRVGEVTDSIEGIDLIMGCGFNWAPPGVLVDTIGLATTVEQLEKCGLKVPSVLEDALKAGRTKPFFADSRVNTGKFFVGR